MDKIFSNFAQGGAYVLRTFINCYMLSRVIVNIVIVIVMIMIMMKNQEIQKYTIIKNIAGPEVNGLSRSADHNDDWEHRWVHHS